MQRPPRRRFFAAALVLAALGCGSSGAPTDAPASDALADSGPAPDASPDVVTASPPEVALPEGTLRGRAGTGFREFLGIPYAAPPVGPNRFRPPQPVAAWTGVREATAAPARCTQTLLGTISGSEDCLYVNVHTPDPAPHNAPVMVWIHGGAFVYGEGQQQDQGTRGDVIARDRGAIVVSMNYRLGALGFLAHGALSAEGGGHSGNYGLMDQRAALQWVQSHIAAFGGDPNNVTLFGESAGAMSVCAHLASPMSSGLFARAAAESGPCGLPVSTLAEGEAQGARLAAALHCDASADVPGCLRAATAQAVFSALPIPPELVSTDPMYGQWAPIVDGAFLPMGPMALFRAGTFARVPLLFGWNRDEGTLFVLLANQTMITATEYPGAVRGLLRNDMAISEQVLARYPLSAFPSAYDAWSAVLGDFLLKCPARRTLRAMAPFLPRAYAYQFTYPNAGFALGGSVPLGAFHSAEIQYIFGHSARLGHPRFVGDELTLHHAMMGYWTRFASTGDPNGEGAVPWPMYTPSGEESLTLDVTPAASTAVGAEVCAFWEGLGIYP